MKKLFEATIIIETEQEATKYIAQSVCDGLEEPTAVKHIHIKEYKEPNTEQTAQELLNKISDFIANGEPKSAENLINKHLITN